MSDMDRYEVIEETIELDLGDGSAAIQVPTATGKEMTVHIALRDMERFKLFVWELSMLRDRMVVGASPFATELDRIIDRYVDGGDDEVLWEPS